MAHLSNALQPFGWGLHFSERFRPHFQRKEQAKHIHQNLVLFSTPIDLFHSLTITQRVPIVIFTVFYSD